MASMLQQCPGPQYLKPKAGAECPELGLLRLGYLMVKPLANLLSVCHLTSVESDTAGSYPLSQVGDPSIHLRCAVNSLLQSLRRLHCRMDSICESLLELPTHDMPLNLEEVIVNSSLSELSDTIMSYHYPNRCQSIPGQRMRLEAGTQWDTGGEVADEGDLVDNDSSAARNSFLIFIPVVLPSVEAKRLFSDRMLH
ncbi:hypothetical protein HD806DRAFT_528767 [Xylariaceae sp. AK1471]|nr:hypothetical protein HD806DRAFT_528767 [Xylariaceae sp. AK1471]